MEFYFLIPIFIFALYFAPALEAWRVKKTNAKAIFWLNLLLGWTFIGWVVALVWSLTKDPNQQLTTEKVVAVKPNVVEKPFYKKFWFWAVIAVVLLIGISNAMSMLSATDENKPAPKTTNQPSDITPKELPSWIALDNTDTSAKLKNAGTVAPSIYAELTKIPAFTIQDIWNQQIS